MKKFFSSFGYALRGVGHAIRQRNIRVQFVCALAVIAGGFYFDITLSEWLMAMVMIALVLSLEMINTAIENLVDLVTMERKPLAGKIKDIAAGAVLVASVVAVVVGILIFAKYLV